MEDTMTASTLLRRLSAPVPPTLEVAMGYGGDREWVYFWTDPRSLDTFYNDGEGHKWAYPDAYIRYVRHPRVRSHLASLGGHQGLRTVLLLHRPTRTAYTADVDEAVSRVWAQRRTNLLRRTSHEAGREEARTIDRLTTRAHDRSAVDGILEEHARALDEMSEWLSAQPDA